MTNLSLRTKIIISLTGLILLFAFGAAFYGRHALSGILGTELNEKGASMGKNLSLQTEPLLLVDDAFSLYELFSSKLISDKDVRYIFVELPEGVIRYHTFAEGIPQGLRQANRVDSNLEQSFRIINTNESKVLDIATPILEGGEGTLRLGLSYARQESIIRKYIYVLLLLAGIATLFALLISHFLARLLTRPLAALSKVTCAVVQGELSLQVPQGGDEIGRLGTDFNIMTKKLSQYRDELLQRNRELTTLYQEVLHKEELHSHLLRQVIKAQEEERKRIAREMHDDVGQVLSGIAVVLEDVEKKGHESHALMERLSRIRGEATYALQSLREIILNLRPTVLDDLGLIPAIRWYARERLEKAGVRFNIEVKRIKERLNPQIEITLFRVIQEAINNIAKYAQAREVSLSLELNDGKLAAEIRDDGLGFDVEKVLYSTDMKGLGLLGMKERLTLIDGTFKISSTPGKGTVIHMDIPYVKDVQA